MLLLGAGCFGRWLAALSVRWYDVFLSTPALPTLGPELRRLTVACCLQLLLRQVAIELCECLCDARGRGFVKGAQKEGLPVWA